MSEDERPTWARHSSNDWTGRGMDAQKIEDRKRSREYNACIERMDAQMTKGNHERVVNQRASGEEKNPTDWSKG